MRVNKLSRALLGIMCARGFDGGSVPSGQLQVGVEVSRTMRVELAGEGEARAYAATLSSEAPAMQWFGREILLHTPEAINLERAQGNGLVLLWNHCTDQPIGRAQGVKLVDAKLRATSLVFSGRAQAQEVKADVDAGLLGDMSIRYTIDDYDEVISPVDGELTIIVKRWTPLEASIVPIPADPSVGVGRSAQRNAGGTGSGDGSINIDEFKAQRLAAERSGITIGAQRERERIAAIDSIFAPYRARGAEYIELRDLCVAKNSTEAQASRALLELINSETGMGTLAGVDGRVGDDARRSLDVREGARVSAGADVSDKFVEGATRALEFRSGLLRVELKDHARAREVRLEMRQNPFAGLTMRELAREYLRMRGLTTTGMSADDVVKYALAPWTHPDGRRDFLSGLGTSDFTAVLENNMNKGLTVGYIEADETWPLIVREGSLNDYKAGTRTNIGAMSALSLIAENGEYKYASITDVKEPIQIKKRGVIIAITREAIINDDLDAFTKIPLMAGRAAARAVGDAVYALLTANAALAQDSVALFHSTHANIGSSGAPSVARLDEADKLMAVQKSPGSAESGGLNTELARVIVPRALKTTARVLQTSQYDPAGAAGTLKPNPFSNNFVTVSDARLDATSASVWYATADPNTHDTIEVAFLNGNREPFLESRDGWNVDGIETKVRHEFAAAVLDYRGMVRMPG